MKPYEPLEPMRVGVVGVGMISDVFISNAKRLFHNLEPIACAARDMDRVRAKAAQHGLAPMTLDELLTDPSVELVLNLTPVETHAEVIERALRAGKNVFSEKTMTPEFTSARALAELAEESGVRLGCAPDTFLGSGLQTAAAAVADGRIGEPTGFTVMLNRGLDLLYEFMPFLLRPGAGIGFDFGVYGLTSVLSILGPAMEVCGFQLTNRPQRKHRVPGTPQFGQAYTVENENVMTATLQLASGVLGTVAFNGDSVFPEKPYLCIQGTEGLIFLPDPNSFGGEVTLVQGFTEPTQLRDGVPTREVLPVRHRYSENSRGLGAAEMVDAIRSGRPHRASSDLACHVLEILEGIVTSSTNRRYHQLSSTFTIPQPLVGDEAF